MCRIFGNPDLIKEVAGRCVFIWSVHSQLAVVSNDKLLSPVENAFNFVWYFTAQSEVKIVVSKIIVHHAFDTNWQDLSIAYWTFMEYFLAFRRNLDGTYWYDLQMCRILADPNVGF